ADLIPGDAHAFAFTIDHGFHRHRNYITRGATVRSLLDDFFHGPTFSRAEKTPGNRPMESSGIRLTGDRDDETGNLSSRIRPDPLIETRHDSQSQKQMLDFHCQLAGCGVIRRVAGSRERTIAFP